MLAAVKEFLPIILYFVGIATFFMAITGRVQYALAFTVFLFPLRNVVERLQEFPLGKDMIDLLIMGMLIGWLINTLVNRKKFFESTPLSWTALIMIGYMLISVFVGYSYLNYFTFLDFSDPRVQTWKNFSVLPILFLITFNNVRDKKWMWRILIVMFGTMVLMDMYQIRQIAWFSSLESREKIHGTFQYLGPNEVAAFYNMYTVFMLSLFFCLKDKKPKPFMAGLTWANLFCVLFLFSRAAYLGLVAGLFFLFALRKRVLLIPLVILVISWQTMLPEKVRERIEMTTNEYGQLDVSSQRRIDIWHQSIDLFVGSPIVGVGLGIFRFLGYDLGDTHNIYLKILAEQGLIGLFIFLLLLWLVFLQGMRLYSRSEDDFARGMGLGLSALIIVLLINNMFGDRWTYMEISGYWWILAGMVCRLNLTAVKARVNKRIKKDPMVELIEKQAMLER